MAHFAELDSNNVVTRVIVVANQDVLDSNGNEDETVGIEYLKGLFGESTNWKQTSYNGTQEQDMQEKDSFMIQAEMYFFIHNHTHLGL